MGWSQRYRLKSYLASSLWIIPLAAIPLALALTRVLHNLDQWLGWTLLGLAREGAQALFETIITAMLSFVVFTFGSLLVAVQIAGGQLTPRIIATTLLRDGTVKYVVGLFIFTLFFAVSALDRMGKDVSQFIVFVAACLGIAGFAAFLYLIDYAARLLRPVSILARVGDAGIAGVYPDPAVDTPPVEPECQFLGVPSRVVNHERTSGIVLAVNVPALVAAAEKAGGAIEFAPQVGDFVARADPLFKLYDGAASIDPSALIDSVVFGSERTLDQDPTFAFRIVVDIALRALSPAINDPTTAVLGIDQLHRMLRRVGQRHLRTDRILDKLGRLRVYFRTPNWEDFVHLAFCEIRGCGSNNLQIVRRLRDMIDNLIATLPRHCHAALGEQRSLLDRAIEAQFKEPELSLARMPDPQGLGGHSGLRARQGLTARLHGTPPGDRS
jgi:uncharacterized membrane protein